jgi:hypothetical protein
MHLCTCPLVRLSSRAHCEAVTLPSVLLVDSQSAAHSPALPPRQVTIAMLERNLLRLQANFSAGAADAAAGCNASKGRQRRVTIGAAVLSLFVAVVLTARSRR